MVAGRMADPVAIVSVSTSGAIGLAGIFSSARAGISARRWQGKEERIAELRTVLDTGAVNLANAMQAMAEANRALTTGRMDLASADQMASAKQYLSDALTAQKALWITSNRLRIRRGSTSPVAEALRDAERKVGLLGALVGRKVQSPATPGYEAAWAEAEASERAFYDAAAAELRVASKSDEP
jgi:hypothetical protein